LETPFPISAFCFFLSAFPISAFYIGFMKDELVSRISISLPGELLHQFDEMSAQKGYENRSLAMSEMIRDRLVDHRQKFGDEEIAGTITLVYDHHRQHVQETLTNIQHDYHDTIISTLHVHLDHHNCLEVLVVRGKAAMIKKIADSLIGAKGIKHGKLTVTSTGDLP
jgi:CopG family nickel-responsive transcriptional regulator